MVLRDKLILGRQSFFDKVQELTIEFATKFGYPENKGMPLVPSGVGSDGQPYLGFKFYDSDILTIRKIPSPLPVAQNLTEIIFGAVPKVQPLDRLFYESSTDGFYSFYIENYKNLFFLPNWFSQFLQINLNFCLDITFLEIFREVLFLSIVGFAEIVTFRILLSWIISINPYTFPWNYFIALVDWTEETLIGLVPSIVGVNLSGPILITILGKCADSLNNLVFTMPYLPSEGEPTKILINGEVRNVLAFRYLPVLWYEHPIPNQIREYWYNERPDILKYMQKAYKNLNIKFLPDIISDDTILNSLNEVMSDQIIEEKLDLINEHLIDKTITLNNIFDSNSLFDSLNKITFYTKYNSIKIDTENYSNFLIHNQIMNDNISDAGVSIGYSFLIADTINDFSDLINNLSNLLENISTNLNYVYC